MLVGVDVDELQHALGGVVLEAAYLERVLRAAFSALVGSKYAAVVDGRLTAAALIEDCERITRYHTAITRPAKEEIETALRACHEANRNRNRVIHDTWATRPGSVMVTLRGSRTSHDVTVTVQTLAEVRQLAVQLADAAHELGTAMTTALGPDWARLENQLRQELGHDIDAAPGPLRPRGAADRAPGRRADDRRGTCSAAGAGQRPGCDGRAPRPALSWPPRR